MNARDRVRVLKYVATAKLAEWRAPRWIMPSYEIELMFGKGQAPCSVSTVQ